MKGRWLSGSLPGGSSGPAIPEQTGRPSTLQPDVAVFDRRRLLGERAKGMYAQHVLLAKELSSPGNTKKEMNRKIQIYRQLGAYEVWVVEQSLGIRVMKNDDTCQFIDRGIARTPSPLHQFNLDFDLLFNDV